MSISNIWDSASNSEIHSCNQIDGRKNPYHQISSHQSKLSSDTVSISEEAAALIGKSSQADKPAKVDNQHSEENLPLEYYSVPNWLADLSPVVLQPVDLSNGFVPYESMFKRGYGLKEEYPNELREYNQLIRGHYQELLQEQGISSTRDHYEAMIVDKNKSEQMRQKMQEKISADPRAVELAQLFQINIG
ncbi:MAG: hypothetical protein D5R98_01815 [Desulfonatronovibrio sp. MSAO_Bac4]|nr:MAG: hypothetical protein D5R98_01815 [Desulfonatronovibrio sp. MSAO_Bac4]